MTEDESSCWSKKIFQGLAGFESSNVYSYF